MPTSHRNPGVSLCACVHRPEVSPLSMVQTLAGHPISQLTRPPRVSHQLRMWSTGSGRPLKGCEQHLSSGWFARRTGGSTAAVRSPIEYASQVRMARAGASGIGEARENKQVRRCVTTVARVLTEEGARARRGGPTPPSVLNGSGKLPGARARFSLSLWKSKPLFW